MKVTIPLRELRRRVKELPVDRDDCYLVSIQTSAGKELGSERLSDGRYDEDGVYPIPFMARNFDPVRFAIEENDEEWERQYGGDWCRLGCNTPSVSATTRFVFQWGEGHPDGILPHEPNRINFCRHCAREIRGHVSDCLARRAHALADAVLQGDAVAAKTHAEYVKANHNPPEWMRGSD
jgi:hypothetical protein